MDDKSFCFFAMCASWLRLFRSSADPDRRKCALADVNCKIEVCIAKREIKGRHGPECAFISELLGAAQEGMLRDFQFYSAEVVPIDSNSALVTFNLVVDMPEGDDPGMAPRYQKVSDLWVREGNDWRLKFEQATPVRPVD